ncbi:hypothetical protein B6U91_00685 [Candidatus Pacearchaeota archaeon ex4484_71]|nr:MAG: hypothetical protein B6U91_00685 [Candidatus Pacearchaeota archaeon ex4484_71]
MTEFESKIKSAIEELKSSKKRKFDQTVDLVVNLQKFDVRKNPLNLFLKIPYKIKDKKVAAFLESKSTHVDTITFDEFKKYNNKKKLKDLVKKYDFFIAQASLMPKVATTFGRVLGPAGKMPSPQLGIILNADEKSINEIKEKVNNSVKIKIKEASIKLAVGKESMPNEEIFENINTIYKEIIKALPRNKENVKNIELKLTMSKPVKINVR